MAFSVLYFVIFAYAFYHRIIAFFYFFIVMIAVQDQTSANTVYDQTNTDFLQFFLQFP